MSNSSYQKGRGAQLNVHNRFLKDIHEQRDDFLEFCRISGEEPTKNTTERIPIFPKSIVNRVTSPDVGMHYSLNPYQGCEHGCIYCYARNAHEFWGYSAGKDFEQKILFKKDAPLLLEKLLQKKSWKAETIVLSGNTDCYQPIERDLKLTRACLQVFLKYRHPVGIITKNALILRDLDVLRELNALGLVGINISITSLEESTRRLLEPRTASVQKRLKAIETLSKAGIPVNAMLAPIIPGINSHELLTLAKAVSDRGARSFGFTVVRLNGAIGEIFTDWLYKAMPDKAAKVLSLIAQCHDGKLNDSRFGSRMKGDGAVAEQIHQMVQLAKAKYFKGKRFPKLRTDLHEAYKDGQLKLF
ncbi:PA0069 family radical SAM protein [Flavobacterium sp. ASW18X]|uniref:PA0069 family radical SAM protein n=1 Tax=Flavobacterium sp. ASW18X TaxID=2572595 RepID=UPI0010ADF0BA|nr:PA0069 family radical SAM protein [Flavobacterium sp. ASW18X]TKD67248.1 PA0069 family radical SAM protein [Flavobacterium sp. ASW18X]